MKRLAAVLLLLLCAGTPAQTRHDPLTSLEVDQMRDSAQDPKRRIDLLLGFARARLLAVERLHRAANPDPRDVARAEELLGDFALLIDELDDNLAMYSKHGEDLRHHLRRVLDAEAGFQQRLEALAEHAALLQSRGVETHSGMATALEEASDSLQSSSESANAMLAAEIRKRGELRNGKKPGRGSSQPQSSQPPNSESGPPEVARPQ
jgi:hypothetical protein